MPFGWQPSLFEASFPPWYTGFFAVPLPFLEPKRVSKFPIRERRSGWVPSILRDLGALTCYMSANTSLDPFIVVPSAFRRPAVTKPPQRFIRIHPSELPLAWFGSTADPLLRHSYELHTPSLPMTHVACRDRHWTLAYVSDSHNGASCRTLMLTSIPSQTEDMGFSPTSC